MGQGKSRFFDPGAADCVKNPQEFRVSGNREGGSQEGSIPQDSPLGMMIRFWDEWESQRGKSKQKMIKYCMFEWTKEMIRKDNLYWPKFGSFEDWICQALNIYVNSKDPVNQEESEYAALWSPEGRKKSVVQRQDRGHNIGKALSDHQKKEESPAEWLERLKRGLQLYSGIDTDTAVGQVLLKTQFVTRSWGDIRRKLEKLEDWQDKGLQELLREAQRVYVQRDEKKLKADARILVAAVQEVQAALNTEKSAGKNKQPMSGSIFKNTGPVQISRHKKRHLKNSCPTLKGAGPTCFYCHKKGHLQKNCRKKQQDEKTSQENQRGQEFCSMKGTKTSPEEALIKLKIGPNSEEVIFLVNTGVSQSTVTKLPQGCEISRERVPVIGITGEVFPVPVIKGVQIETDDKFGVNDLLLIPEAENNLLGRDLIIALNLQIKPCEGKLKIYSLTEEDNLEINDTGWHLGEVGKSLG